MKRSGYFGLVRGAGSGFASAAAFLSDGAARVRGSRPPRRCERPLMTNGTDRPDCAGGREFAARVSGLKRPIAPIRGGFGVDVPRNASQRRCAQWNDLH